MTAHEWTAQEGPEDSRWGRTWHAAGKLPFVSGISRQEGARTQVGGGQGCAPALESYDHGKRRRSQTGGGAAMMLGHAQSPGALGSPPPAAVPGQGSLQGHPLQEGRDRIGVTFLSLGSASLQDPPMALHRAAGASWTCGE